MTQNRTHNTPNSQNGMVCQVVDVEEFNLRGTSTLQEPPGLEEPTLRHGYSTYRHCCSDFRQQDKESGPLQPTASM